MNKQEYMADKKLTKWLRSESIVLNKIHLPHKALKKLTKGLCSYQWASACINGREGKNQRGLRIRNIALKEYNGIIVGGLRVGNVVRHKQGYAIVRAVDGDFAEIQYIDKRTERVLIAKLDVL